MAEDVDEVLASLDDTTRGWVVAELRRRRIPAQQQRAYVVDVLLPTYRRSGAALSGGLQEPRTTAPPT